MKTQRWLIGIVFLLICSSAFSLPAKLSPPEESAAFKTAGYKLKGRQWRACDDPSASYTPGAIQEVRDINGDGLPEVLITEGGTFCYGNTGAGYSLVSKQANGSWILVTSGTGMLSFLTTKGVGAGRISRSAGLVFVFPSSAGMANNMCCTAMSMRASAAAGNRRSRQT